MTKINKNFVTIPPAYLFSEISKKISEYQNSHRQADIIRMGIGDVTLPLPSACVDAIVEAANEQRIGSTFRGYGPEQGYDFLRNTIVDNDFKARGLDIDPGEVFVSDGAKSDTGNILDIFAACNVVAITDPSYPVYVDSNAMSGRAGIPLQDGKWSNLVYLPCNISNNFIPELPKERVDIIYLCYPNNPTGTTLTKELLADWVNYAIENQSIILFDAAYEAYITEKGIPRSIYEIEGAKNVALEFRSFSKTAGFTGVRCGYTVIPKKVTALSEKGNKISLNELWLRRQTTKFNGASYIAQRAAEAVYSPEGKKEIRSMIGYYMDNARIIRESLEKIGLQIFGGINAPYVWAKTPAGVGSWEYFDYLLKDKNIVCTPGVGFGVSGEGYVRFSAFGDKENTQIAMDRLSKG